MIFIDKEGVTFTVDNGPAETGWEKQDTPFVLWFEPRNLSCRLYYVMAVRVLADRGDELSLTVNVGDSDVFSILPSRLLNKDISGIRLSGINGRAKSVIMPERGNYMSCFPLREPDSDEPSKYMFTVYFVGRHDSEETVLKNVKFTLRHGKETVDSAVVRIGGVFKDESQELLVNGTNMGVKLPADICKAFWNCGYKEYYPDRVEQRNKLRELLFNYMGIKGRCGSYESVIKSLKWFGWGDRIDLRQLVSLNEKISGLFLTKDFDRPFEPRKWFSDFRRTTFLSLRAYIRKLSGIGDPEPMPDEGTWESGKAIIPAYSSESEDGPVWSWNERLFEDNERYTGVYNDFELESRYDYIMTELGLKLACLAALYEEHFLPVQLNVVSSSVVDTVSAAPLKLLCGTSTHTSQNADAVTPHGLPVFFPKTAFSVYWDMLDSFTDISFSLRDAETASYSAYIATGDGKLVYATMDAFERGTAKFTMPLTNIDPEDIRYLSVLVDGSWFETEIEVRYPKIEITPGALKYRYSEDTVMNPETDLFITRSFERYTEEFRRTEPDSDISDIVTGKAKINPTIPLSKMNLVMVCDIEDSEIDISKLGITGMNRNVKIMNGDVDVSEEFEIFIVKNVIYEPGKPETGAPYFIYVSSKYPLYLWSDEKLNAAGIESLSSDYIERWLRKQCPFVIRAPYGLGRTACEFKWLAERFNFTEPEPDAEGWTDYSFYKDDIVACRISGVPYLPPFHEDGHRVVFRPASGPHYIEQDFCLGQDPELVMLPKINKYDKYLTPGVYDCEFRFAYGSEKTRSVNRFGAFKILDKIDSRLYRDLKEI